jgi:hypothetical protein
MAIPYPVEIIGGQNFGDGQRPDEPNFFEREFTKGRTPVERVPRQRFIQFVSQGLTFSCDILCDITLLAKVCKRFQLGLIAATK